MPSKPGSATTARSIARVSRIDRIEQLLLDADKPVEPTIRREFPNEDGTPLSERVIKRDIAEAWHRIRARFDAERDILAAKARAKWERRERLADKRGDTQAGNYALDRWTKLLGLYAPTKLEVSGGVSMRVDVRLDGIVGILDAEGLAALEVVMAQIERARAAGLLPEPSDGAEDEPSTRPEP